MLPRAGSPVFKLRPLQIDLRPGQTVEMVLEGCSSTAQQPSALLTLQSKPLSLKNTCALPLSIVLDLEQPFLICDVNQQPLPADSKPMALDVGEELHLCIQFNPAYENDLNSRVSREGSQGVLHGASS